MWERCGLKAETGRMMLITKTDMKAIFFSCVAAASAALFLVVGAVPASGAMKAGVAEGAAEYGPAASAAESRATTAPVAPTTAPITALAAQAPETGTGVYDLRVQNVVRPNAVEDRHPVFSWKMSSDERGQRQTEYEITVTRDSDGSKVWDSGRVESSRSTGIPYQGVALQPEKSYSVRLSVWDKDGNRHEEGTTFQTGLMNPKLSAWEGAKWVGTTRQRLDAASQCIFGINTGIRLVKGDVASLILGAGDFRLENEFLNGYALASKNNYIKVELDFGAKEIRIFRVGYFPGDRADKAFLTINKENYPESNIEAVFSAREKSAEHSLGIYVEASQISFTLDGVDLVTAPPANRFGNADFSVGLMGGTRKASLLKLSDLGVGGDYPSFPNLNSVGFAALPGTEVLYDGYEICNEGQSLDKLVFSEDGYGIFESLPGVKLEGASIRVSNSGSEEIMGWADPSCGALPMLRSEFRLEKAVKSAKLYATAMGSYTVYLNGKRVGDDWFTPGDSQYRETLTYQAYDVTSLLRQGRNAIGAFLSPGWYTGYMTFTVANFNFFGDHEAFLSKLAVTYEDGSREVFVSDPASWKVFSDGPVRSGSFFMGERYVASKEADGWNEAGFDDSSWSMAEEIKPRPWVNFDIVARYDEPVRLRETLEAKRVMPVHSDDGHTYIYDMGVNMVGVPSVTIPAGWLQKGDKVTIAYGEQVYPGVKGESKVADRQREKDYEKRFGKAGRKVAGHILFETNRAALDVDFYTADGSGEVTIQPTSTYRGYQYIQLTLPSHKGALPAENVKGLVLSSCILPTGIYKAETLDPRTSELVNRLFSNIQRSQLGNFFTIPTDCPQRNERMGWTGDAQAYTRTGIYNADTENFYRQWMAALRDDQGVGDDKEVPGGIGSTVPTYNKTDDPGFASGTTWAAAVCQVPWQLYTQYGDRQVVEENLETMMDWLNGMAFYSYSDEYPDLSTKAAGLADWLAMDNRTPSDLINNAIYIHMMEVTAKMAEALGRQDYAATLRERHEKAKAEWNKAYVDPASGRTRSLEGLIVHTQASYATPLNFNVFSDENKARAEEYLAALAANPALSGPTDEEWEEQKGKAKDDPMAAFMGGAANKPRRDFSPYTITTGFSGTPNILPALTRGGYADTAYRLFTSTKFASWLYPVSEGATSIWERWNSYDSAFSENTSNSMNSFNHFALGAVGQWMYEYQLGITCDFLEGKAGYSDFVLQPVAGPGFTSLEGGYESNYGLIKSAWKADGKGGITSYSATVPANTVATLYLPVSALVTAGSGAEGAEFKGFSERNKLRVAVFSLASGTYEFTISASSVTAE